LPHTHVLIRRPNPVDAREMQDLLAIYEDAIPASERKSGAYITAMPRNPDYCVLGAFLAGRLAGFAIVYRFRGVHLSLLEYMAVDPAHRSQGIGGQLLHAALGIFEAATPMLVEVESDREPSAVSMQRAMRKAFYRRFGCREVEGLTYILPIGDHPPAMNLLVHDARRNEIDRATILQWLTSLYGEVYGRPASDPRIALMAASLPEKTALI
jgi:GNAT superfamily N-acetyltransferase